jgi:hypothetical protein
MYLLVPTVGHILIAHFPYYDSVTHSKALLCVTLLNHHSKAYQVIIMYIHNKSMFLLVFVVI